MEKPLPVVPVLMVLGGLGAGTFASGEESNG